MSEKNNTDKNVDGRTEPTDSKKKAEAIAKKVAAADQALEGLKRMASAAGLTFHPTIGLAALQEKLEEHLNKQQDELPPAPTQQAAQVQPQQIIIQQPDPNVDLEKRAAAEAEKKAQESKLAMSRAMELVRVRITNMNPDRRKWPGKIYTAGNSMIPTVKKYVPFNGKPWHVPRIIFNMLKNEKFQQFETIKGPDGKERKVGKLVPALGVEVLPPLTPEELKELAREQSATQRLED